MQTDHSQTPLELIFPPQVPFSWTLRLARANRLKAERKRRTVSLAPDTPGLAAAIAFCSEHGATFALD